MFQKKNITDKNLSTTSTCYCLDNQMFYKCWLSYSFK